MQNKEGLVLDLFIHYFFFKLFLFIYSTFTV